MYLPTDLITWFKVIGAVSTAAGSLLLAWRVKKILQWVIYCLVAHEQSITQLRRITSNQAQTAPMVEGITRHLLDVESKFGLILLVLGFISLGIGMLCNAVTYLLVAL